MSLPEGNIGSPPEGAPPGEGTSQLSALRVEKLPDPGATRTSSSHVPFRLLLAVVAGVVLFLAPELVGLRRLGGGALDAWTTPVWAYAHERLLQHDLPRWNPYLFCGMPLIGHPSCGVYYPLNWLAWILPAEHAIPLTVFVHLVLAATGACLLLRRFGCRPVVAVSGGLVTAVGAALPGSIVHLEQLEVWAWWPWILLFLEEDRGLAASVVVALQGLAGDPQGVLLSGLGGVVWMLVRQARAESSVNVLGNALGIWTLGLGMAAVQWISYAELYNASVRHLGGVSKPTVVHITQAWWPGHGTPVLLVTAVLLAGVGLLAKGRAGHAVQGLWAASVVAMVLAMGPGGPGGWLVHWLTGQPRLLPQLAAAACQAVLGDEPVRWVMVAAMATCLAAGVGLEHLFQRRDRAGWAVLLLQLGLAVVVGRLEMPTAPDWVVPEPVQSALATLQRTGGRYAVAGPVDARVYDLGVFMHVGDATGFSSMAPRDILDVLTFAALHHLVEDPDRDVLLAHDHRIASDGLNPAILKYLSVDTLLYTSGSGPVAIRHMPGAVPRVRVVTHRYVYPRDKDPIESLPPWAYSRAPEESSAEEDPSPQTLSHELLERMASPSTAAKGEEISDPLHAVLLDQEPAMKPLPVKPPPLRATAKVTEDEPEHVVVEVQSSETGLLVLADAWSEGWWATVNGHPVRVYPADGVMRAVVVPVGASRVEFTYAPPGWTAGWQLTLLTLGLVAFLAVRDTMMPRPRPAKGGLDDIDSAPVGTVATPEPADSEPPAVVGP